MPDPTLPQATLRRARDAGAEPIRDVANVAMYERYGYRETHREPYLGTDLVVFRKDLATDAPMTWTDASGG
jgi:hypothetical protein